MVEQIELVVGNNKINELIKGEPKEGIKELVWNGLDGESDNIYITINKDEAGFLRSIKIVDDGNGIDFKEIDDSLKKFGESNKVKKIYTPKKKRRYVGKEGSGRFKALRLGNILNYTSVYTDEEDSKKKRFNFHIEAQNPKFLHYTKAEILSDDDYKNIENGVTVEISELKTQESLYGKDIRQSIEKDFAIYYSKYPDFKVYVNNEPINFESQYFDSVEFSDKYNLNGLTIPYKIKLIEWKEKNLKDFKKEYLYCNSSGYCLKREPLNLRKSKTLPVIPNIPVSMNILCDYFEESNIELNYDPSNILPNLKNNAKEILINYLNKRSKQIQNTLIKDLKDEEIYPYEKPKNKLEAAEQKIFDFITIKINEHKSLQDIKDKDHKKALLYFIKNSLERGGDDLEHILSEYFFIKLPEEDKQSLNQLLKKTSFKKIINSSQRIFRRIEILKGLYDICNPDNLSSNFERRKNLHQLLMHETWIFDEKYNLALSSKDLNNLINKSINTLERKQAIEKIIPTNILEEIIRLFIDNNRENIVNKIGKLFYEENIEINIPQIFNNEKKRALAARIIKIINNNEKIKLLSLVINSKKNENFCLALFMFDKNKKNNLKNIVKKLRKSTNIKKDTLELKKTVRNEYSKEILDIIKSKKDLKIIDEFISLISDQSYHYFAKDVSQLIKNQSLILKISEIINSGDIQKLSAYTPNCCVGKKIPLNKNNYDYLILEIKKPSFILNREEWANFESFKDKLIINTDKNKLNQSKFILICNDIDKSLISEIENGKIQKNIFDEKVEFQAITWKSLLQEAINKMNFINSELEYEPDIEESIKTIDDFYATIF